MLTQEDSSKKKPVTSAVGFESGTSPSFMLRLKTRHTRVLILQENRFGGITIWVEFRNFDPLESD